MSISRGLPELPTAPDVDITDEQLTAAQRTVASFSTDADECRIFLAMLGIGRQPDVDKFVVDVWPTAFNT